MANTSLIAQLNVMAYFGLTAEILRSIDQSKPTTLRFKASTSCTFLKQEIVEVASQRTEVEEQHLESSLFGSTSRSTIKQVVLEVPQYIIGRWTFIGRFNFIRVPMWKEGPL